MLKPKACWAAKPFRSQFVKGATAPCVRFFVITFGQSRDPINCEDKKASDIKMIKEVNKRDNKKTLKDDGQERKKKKPKVLGLLWWRFYSCPA